MAPGGVIRAIGGVFRRKSANQDSPARDLVRREAPRFVALSAAVALTMAACGGQPAPTTTAAAPSTTQPAPSTESPTTTTIVPTASTAPSTTATTTDPTAALGYTFRQVTRETETASVLITYPALTELGDGAEAAINRTLDDWAERLAEEFIVDATDSGAANTSVLEVELAPEVRSRSVFSVSGLQFEFDAAADFSSTRRVGWIFAIDDGASVAADALFADGSLEQLAAAAEEHLIADVLGDPALLTAPAGLSPSPENFDAVWLTPDGIAVGFDQYQVAAAEAGSPAVLIPYSELADALDLSGILAALEGDMLPTGL